MGIEIEDVEIILADVERPVPIKERYGDITISKIVPSEPGDKESYSFEDELVRIVWSPNNHVGLVLGGLSFDLTNKSDRTIKILWSESAGQGVDGTSHPITYAEIKLDQDIRATKPPSVVMKRGRLHGIIWTVDEGSFLWPKYQEAEATKSIGKSFSLGLAIEIDGAVNEYLFAFTVKDVKVGSSSGCFIATACTSEDSIEVGTLREFRDTYLLQSHLGRGFVERYYKYSPAIADWIGNKPVVRRVVKEALISPIARMVSWYIG